MTESEETYLVFLLESVIEDPPFSSTSVAGAEGATEIHLEMFGEIDGGVIEIQAVAIAEPEIIVLSDDHQYEEVFPVSTYGTDLRL